MRLSLSRLWDPCRTAVSAAAAATTTTTHNSIYAIALDVARLSMLPQKFLEPLSPPFRVIAVFRPEELLDLKNNALNESTRTQSQKLTSRRAIGTMARRPT